MCIVEDKKLTIMNCFLSQGVTQLAITLAEEQEDHIQAAAAWALGQIGRHTPEHAKAVAVANVLPKLLECYLRADASEDLQTKVRLMMDRGLFQMKKVIYLWGFLTLSLSWY